MTRSGASEPVSAPAAVARFATTEECANWDALVAGNPGGGEVWMSEAYLGVKRARGRYRDYRVIVDRGSRPSIAVGVLAKRVPLLGEWWHLPAGPDGEDAEAVTEVTRALSALAGENGAFLLKVEPRTGRDTRERYLNAGWRETVRIIPNPSTVIVPLPKGEAESARSGGVADGRTVDDAALLASLGKKARNSINRAARDGITAERVEASDANCALLYSLLQETAEGRFVLRSADYYRDFWQRFARAGEGQMFFARRDGRLIAGAYAIALGDKTTYKDGASVREKTAYGASHAVQWEVIRWAAERGATAHDLCGAPPSDRADDRSHPLHGVGQFKRSFSPETTDYAGSFDLPLRPRAFALWARIGDRVMRRWSLWRWKDPYY